MEIQNKMIDATKEIFSTMVMMEISLEGAIEEYGPLTDTITAMIGLAGKRKGVLAVHFPYPVAMAITSSFLMMDIEEMNADVHDAMGEIANMLGGNVKTILSENGKDIDLSMPSTICGSEYSFQSDSDVDSVIIKFGTEKGPFMVEMNLES